MPRAVVLTFERLSRRCLGCYGHEWIETPHLDRLASRGVVFDQHFVSPQWRSACDPATEWNAQMRDAGIDARLLAEPAADDESDSLANWPFARLIRSAETALSEWAKRGEASWLLWLKSAEVVWPNVALDTFAELYADELEADVDSVREAEIAYAACLTQLDHVLGKLLETINRLFGDDPPLLIVTSLAGESLGEAEPLPLSSVSTAPPESASGLRDELVHVPLILANATRDRSGGRRQELTIAADIFATLRDWFGLNTGDDSADGRSLLPPLRSDAGLWRESLVLRDLDGSAALRTADYLLVRPDSADQSPARLYLKPEDTWEVNDVSEQHQDLVAELLSRLTQQSAEPATD